MCKSPVVGILHIQQEENLFYMEVVELSCTSLSPFVLPVLFLLGGYVFHPFLSIALIYVFVSSQDFSHEFQTFPLSTPPCPAPFPLTVPSLSSLCLNSNQNPSVHSYFPPPIYSSPPYPIVLFSLSLLFLSAVSSLL